jgi:hypothetical protein
MNLRAVAALSGLSCCFAAASFAQASGAGQSPAGSRSIHYVDHESVNGATHAMGRSDDGNYALHNILSGARADDKAGK